MMAWAGKLLIAGISLFVTLLLIEWSLGFYEATQARDALESPEPFYPFSFNTSEGERIGGSGYLELAMDPAALYINLPGQQTPYFTTGPQGFRGPEQIRRPGDATIVVVGGSTAFGTGLANDEEAFSARLEASMERVHAVNGAVIGHLSGQELGYLVHELVDLKPDLVIALDGFNDLVDQIRGPRRTARTVGFNNTFFLMEKRLRDLYLLENGGFFARITSAGPLVFRQLSRLVSRSRDAEGEWKPGDEPLTSGRWFSREPGALAEVYAANIIKMKTVTEAFGGRFLCVLQPDLASFSDPEQGDSVARLYDQFRQRARERLEQADVDVIDLNDYEKRFKRKMFMDRIHLNARGNRLMAQIVQETIEERELLAHVGSAAEAAR